MKTRGITLLPLFLSAGMLSACAGTSQNGLPTTLTPIAPNGTRYDIGTEIRYKNSTTICCVYVSEYYGGILEYNYDAKGSPLCTLSGIGEITDLQSDVKKQLIVTMDTGAESGKVNVYKESERLCLSSIPIGTFATKSPAYTGFSLNGKTFYIGEQDGSVAVCKLGRKPGCHKYLSNSSSADVWGITADGTGVYAAVAGTNSFAHLVYWQGATGPGTVLSGYVNKSPGGVYFDGFGNLLAIQAAPPALYVYTGCPSACKAHGPFPLGGSQDTLSGGLGRGDNQFMAVNEDGEIDVYQYNGIYGLSFLYSNTTGLSASLVPDGLAQQL